MKKTIAEILSENGIAVETETAKGKEIPFATKKVMEAMQEYADQEIEEIKVNQNRFVVKLLYEMQISVFHSGLIDDMKGNLLRENTRLLLSRYGLWELFLTENGLEGGAK